MAAKDVRNYYMDVQAQYTQLVDFMERIKEDYQNGLIDRERLEEMMVNAEVDNLRANYETLAYIVSLLAKPSSKKSREEYDKIFRDLGVTKEQKIDKNELILKKFKQLYEEYKEGK